VGTLWALSVVGARLTHPGHSEIAGRTFQKGQTPMNKNDALR